MLRRSMRMFCSVVAAALLFSNAACAEEFVRISTSSIGGGFYQIGNTVAQLGNSMKNGINYTAITGGSAKNLIALSKRNAEFGLCQSAVIFQGITGTGPFKQPLKSLRFVTAVYPMPCHVLVNGDGIDGIADFRGKKVDYGPIGEGIEVYTRIVLGAYAISDDDVKINRFGKSESAEALKTGTVNCNFWATTVPNAQVTDMISGGVRLLPIDAPQLQTILKEHPYYSASVIPGGSYRGFEKDIPTFAAIGAIVTHDQVSDEVVYNTVKAMYENAGFLKERLPNYFADFSLEHALDGCSMEVHPGALKYYKEVGLVK
jgi:TRAP transporter TAXI family solute receptor